MSRSGPASSRSVSHEILDELAPTDPRARRSRRDLRRVNRIMGACAILRHALQPAIARHSGTAALRVLELGAGDGTLLLRLAQAVSESWPPFALTVLDRQPLLEPATRSAFERAGWSVRALIVDVLDWAGAADPARPASSWDIIVTNLFLHHFEEQALRRVLAATAERCNTFVACEPQRAPLALLGSRLLGVVGANDVTRHDALLSVRAGFRDAELSGLWPNADDAWRIVERTAGLFSHVFRAERREPRR